MEHPRGDASVASEADGLNGRFPKGYGAVRRSEVRIVLDSGVFADRDESSLTRSVCAFLSQVAIGSTQQPRQNGVALLTVHSAKGIEFVIVFVIGMNEGTFPACRARGESIDEEKRNAFVAVTRSRRLLYFTYPEMKIMLWGDEKRQCESRFLKDIKAAIQPVR